jgi:hypothetical protein
MQQRKKHKKLRRRVIDPVRRVIYKSSSPQKATRYNKKKAISFDEIHAVQLLCEMVYTGSNNEKNYECNLILHDATRVHILDRKGYRKVRKDSELLARLLNIPLRDEMLYIADPMERLTLGIKKRHNNETFIS